jgi:hypothetical protein
VSFTFPSGRSLAPGGLAVIVNFDPTDTAALAAFRAKYNLANPAVQVFGPYGGKLGNRGDRVALERPQFPDLPGDPYSWVIVDEVIYGNQTPWPAAANGGGPSLQRAVLGGSGNNPVNWFAAPPTAGLPPPADGDADGMPDEWELAHQLDPNNPADAATDADDDGCLNLHEFHAGTDPRDATSAFKFTGVTACADGVRLQFPVMAGRSYSVQVRDEIGSAWFKLQDVPPGPTNGTASVQDSAATNSPRRLYRVVTPALP